jgi:hypothetical protein
MTTDRGAAMTGWERFIHALGFHDKLEPTDDRIQVRPRELPITGDWIVVGVILRCPTCGRRVRSV